MQSIFGEKPQQCEKIKRGSIQSSFLIISLQIDMKNKVVIITGGSSGIGLALAAKYLAEGSKVVISGRNKSRLEEAVKQ